MYAVKGGNSILIMLDDADEDWHSLLVSCFSLLFLDTKITQHIRTGLLNTIVNRQLNKPWAVGAAQDAPASKSGWR